VIQFTWLIILQREAIYKIFVVSNVMKFHVLCTRQVYYTEDNSNHFKHC